MCLIYIQFVPEASSYFHFRLHYSYFGPLLFLLSRHALVYHGVLVPQTVAFVALVCDLAVLTRHYILPRQDFAGPKTPGDQLIPLAIQGDQGGVEV